MKSKYFPVGNEYHLLGTYLLHNKEVRDYFKDRPDDFLEVNWENGDGWELLCDFLGKEIPDRPFPHANKGKYTLWQKMTRRLHYLVDKEGFKKKNRDMK